MSRIVEKLFIFVLGMLIYFMISVHLAVELFLLAADPRSVAVLPEKFEAFFEALLLL